MMTAEGTVPPLGLEPFIHQVKRRYKITLNIVCTTKQFLLDLTIEGRRPQPPLLPGRSNSVQAMGGARAQFLLQSSSGP